MAGPALVGAVQVVVRKLDEDLMRVAEPRPVAEQTLAAARVQVVEPRLAAEALQAGARSQHEDQPQVAARPPAAVRMQAGVRSLAGEPMRVAARTPALLQPRLRRAPVVGGTRGSADDEIATSDRARIPGRSRTLAASPSHSERTDPCPRSTCRPARRATRTRGTRRPGRVARSRSMGRGSRPTRNRRRS